MDTVASTLAQASENHDDTIDFYMSESEDEINQIARENGVDVRLLKNSI